MEAVRLAPNSASEPVSLEYVIESFLNVGTRLLDAVGLGGTPGLEGPELGLGVACDPKCPRSTSVCLSGSSRTLHDKRESPDHPDRSLEILSFRGASDGETSAALSTSLSARLQAPGPTSTK
mmetsp:Transcript_9628/g.28425  ORF Transcript_9628/g.28425 Transcript_9628/m.28425 type:complete len:122 (+) Transcript_9628:754-1119(+)